MKLERSDILDWITRESRSIEFDVKIKAEIIDVLTSRTKGIYLVC
jgi:hypothetical protein